MAGTTGFDAEGSPRRKTVVRMAEAIRKAREGQEKVSPGPTLDVLKGQS
jgi:hypothetical protein